MKASANYVSNVSSAAMGQWPNLLRHLGIKVPKNGKHGPCPLCGGHDRFRFDDKEGRGTWICNQCGAGDGLSLISKAHGSAIKDAAKLIASLLPDQNTNHDQVKQNIKNQRMHNNYSDEQLEKKRQYAMTRANEMLNESSSDNSSSYIISKGLEALERLRTTTEYRVGGITFHVGSIIVPLINASGVCVNVQLITSTGEKRYLAGGQKQSAFHYIRGKQLFCIVEGYATGLSVHLATGASVYCHGLRQSSASRPNCTQPAP
ncbi:primase-helicase zinc-binding domain-containing protein [Edwardsiella ictaluri]|uniref:primase-helicase zinc-binding domain-containing protein n=1 Tax=Edwardsiella ictaluri TaxID=67780 RepID=UPI0018C8D170|nr:primase-helicase zinc-binding domain-containing protein [Edwardsiella ictaluri]